MHPKATTRESLAAAADVPPTSGGFKNNLGALRSMGLIDYPTPGTVIATPVVFLEVAS